MKLYFRDACSHPCPCVDRYIVYGKIPTSRIHLYVEDDDGNQAMPDLIEENEEGFTVWTIGGPEEDPLTEEMKRVYKSGRWNQLAPLRVQRDALRQAEE